MYVFFCYIDAKVSKHLVTLTNCAALTPSARIALHETPIPVSSPLYILRLNAGLNAYKNVLESNA